MNEPAPSDDQGLLSFEVVRKDGKSVFVEIDNPQALFEKLWEFGFRYPTLAVPLQPAPSDDDVERVAKVARRGCLDTDGQPLPDYAAPIGVSCGTIRTLLAALPRAGLDPATVEACAKVADQWARARGRATIAASACRGVAADIRALTQAPPVAGEG